MTTQIEIYNNLLNKWKETGYIGKVFCNTLGHAKKVSWAASCAIWTKENQIHQINTTSSLGVQGAEPLTPKETCCQLKLVFN